MKLIGNIVSEKPVKTDNRINVVTSINDIIQGLPTLIIGLDFARSIHYDKEVSILEKKICDDSYWTHTLVLNRNDYEIDIENFIQYCYENVVSNITYVFIDVIQFKLGSIKKCINKINTLKNPVAFKYKEFIYLYGDNIIFGIDLRLCEYFFGIKPDKIKNKLTNRCGCVLLTEEILVKYKEYLGRLNSPMYVPYLYSKENE